MIDLKAPLNSLDLSRLCAGDRVRISGYIYTARDQAHKRFVSLLQNGKRLPVDLKNEIIYYTGPSPARPGEPSGSAGPTTSCRMDVYTPFLLKKTGLKALIGKGGRNEEVKKALKETGAVYLAATGGAGALIAQTIKECETVCYEDLEAEAVFRLRVEAFPAVVMIDTRGKSL